MKIVEELILEILVVYVMVMIVLIQGYVIALLSQTVQQFMYMLIMIMTIHVVPLMMRQRVLKIQSVHGMILMVWNYV